MGNCWVGILPYDCYVLGFGVWIWHCIGIFTLVSDGFRIQVIGDISGSRFVATACTKAMYLLLTFAGTPALKGPGFASPHSTNRSDLMLDSLFIG